MRIRWELKHFQVFQGLESWAVKPSIDGLAQRIISNWADSLNPRSKSLLYTFFLHKNSLVKFSSIPEQLDWLFHHKRVMTMHNHGQQDIYKGIKDETFSSE